MQWMLAGFVGLAVAHGLTIVCLSNQMEWKRKIKWYYSLSYLGAGLFAGLLVFSVVAMLSSGAVWADRYTVSIREFIWLNPFIMGTVVIACSVALVIALVEALWTNPFQSASRKPAVIWMVWFAVTMLTGIGIDQMFGDRLKVNRRVADLAAISQSALRPLPQATGTAGTLTLDEAVRAFVEKIDQIASATGTPEQPSPDEGEPSPTGEQATTADGQPAGSDPSGQSVGNDGLEDISTALQPKFDAMYVSWRSEEEDLRSQVAELDQHVKVFWEAEASIPKVTAFDRWSSYRQAIGASASAGRTPVHEGIVTKIKDHLDQQVKSLTQLQKQLEGVNADAMEAQLNGELERLHELRAAAMRSVQRARRCADDGAEYAIMAACFGGGLYYLWCGNVLYRRLNDRDRLVGFAPKRIAFYPLHIAWLRKLLGRGSWRFSWCDIPAQAVVIGPRGSGKTELLRSIQDLRYPLPPEKPTFSTQWPVVVELYDHPYLATIIDCGGENMGDQFDILRTLRADCLVVTICAAHLKDDEFLLGQTTKWSLDTVSELFNEKYTQEIRGSERYTGKSAIDFFQALAYATKRAGGATGDQLSADAAATPSQVRDLRKPRRLRKSAVHAPVQRVLVVLNDRDASGKRSPQADYIRIDCLEQLAKTIHHRFQPDRLCWAARTMHINVVQKGGNGKVTNRTETPVDRSANLSVAGKDITWNKIFAGEWRGCQGSTGHVEGVPDSDDALRDYGTDSPVRGEA